MTNKQSGAGLIDYIKAWPQYLLPHYLLTNLMHALTRVRVEWWRNYFIRWFAWQFRVDLTESQITDPRQFEHFNAFFTRALKDGARPIDQQADSIISPVDGAISQYGDIVDEGIFQAKGREYSLYELVGGEQQWVEQFQNGQFITMYLSPKDYHRIHMPIDGQLTAMKYLPGRLFSVSPATTRAVPRLFARNERVVCAYDTPMGKMLLIMVGALFVGSMESVWHGVITPPHGAQPFKRDYDSDAASSQFKKGDEMGRFNMGSTVILLFERDTLEWNPRVAPGHPLHMGLSIGRHLSRT